MATSLMRKRTLLTNLRPFTPSVGPNYSNIVNNNYYHKIYKQQKHYSRFSNSSRKVGKEVEVPGPSLFGSLISGFSSSSSSSSVVKVFMRNGFVGWYLVMIKSRPIVTKSVTSCLIYVAADFTSQTIALPSSDPYDYIRTLRMAGFGLVVLGPALHNWFNFMSKVLPGRDLLTTAKKITLGQTAFGPIMNVIFFSLNAALQGEDGNEILARLKRDLLPTMINGLMYWPLCDFVTFRFVPVHLQPLVSNAFSYLWTVYITYMASLDKAIE